MTRLLATTIAAVSLSALALAGASSSRAQDLYTFGVLGASTVTNTGPTVIYGNVGVSPGSAITGFPPGTVTAPYSIQSSTVSAEAQSELTALRISLSGESVDQNLAADLTGRVLTSGVYSVTNVAQLAGILTLDAEGDPSARFVFLIPETLIAEAGSSIVLANGAQGANVYWVVGTSVTLKAGTDFAGRILALASISLLAGTTIDCGNAWAETGAVTLINNVINGICAFTVFGDVLGPDSTENDRAVAAALDAYITAHGSLPEDFQDLLLLPADQLAAALDQLSGETATGVAPTGTQAMDSFLSQLFDSAFADDEGTPQPAPNQPPRTVKALGYADEKQPTAVDAAFLALKANPAGRSVWASVYGSRGTTEGDVSVGSSDRFASAFGVAAGYDYRGAPDMKTGVSFGVGRTNYNTTDGLGSGSSDMLQVAVYGKKDFGAAYLAGALAYAYNSVSTTRIAPAVTTDTFDASFSAHDFAARVETGIHYGWITPYAAASAQAFYTPAYQETSSTSSGAAFALAYDDSTTYSPRTELGVRLARSIAIHNGKTVNLHGRVAWAHDFSSAPSVVASFQSLPGAPFTVTGAKQASDFILVSAGADIIFINGFAIGGSFDGAFSDGSQSYGGRAHVRYTW